MNLTNLDLNLLVPLDALLREKSVTRAAGRLGLSQPALSSSLARLRRHFGDQLLVRNGNAYELTPLAAQLRPRAEAALTGVRLAFSRHPGFDPATSGREFRILASDYVMAVLGGAVGAILDERAPGMRLRFEPTTPSVVDQAPESLRGADAVLLPHGFLHGTPHADLFSDTWCCVVATGNERVGGTLTMDDLRKLPWVFTYLSATAFTTVARQLQALGIEPRVTAVVESFLALPHLVAGTERIGLIQGHLAARLSGVDGVRVLPCPFEPVPLVEALWWHPMHEDDPEHRWMREVFAEAGRALAPGDGRSGQVGREPLERGEQIGPGDAGAPAPSISD
ncbi:LysR family transcriptional regulator [Amycolatopsis deserti]|uniref:LysR family transcriptional regulator n=1 Tax=Amycolatopsis deserti TaxID=185696 RepID=A0ABQ3IV68_9PSEU|nr:LysR family transcriptional regulator [Amycolatopsis deserti]GHE90165.1 LysR family transcriptional regulator [Amycolatopsis deserti]